MNDVKHRVLIVEDDDRIVDVVAACAESLGHAWERAANQADAQALLAAKRFCYVLLDLEIPLKANSFSRIQNGENLLEYIAAMKPGCSSKVIVMTSHGNKGHDLAVQMMKKGAIDYVGKPFPTTPGQTLDDKIKEALGKYCKHPPKHCPFLAGKSADADTQPSVDTEGTQPFRGGEMVFFPDRVELLGHRILTSKGNELMRKLLEALAEKRPNGAYAALSGNALARVIDRTKGQNDVAGYVKYLRNQITTTLADAGVSCGRNDVIESGGPGYRLNSRVTVRRQD